MARVFGSRAAKGAQGVSKLVDGELLLAAVAALAQARPTTRAV